MLSTPILLATLASLLALGNAAPVPEDTAATILTADADEIILVAGAQITLEDIILEENLNGDLLLEPAASEGRPIKWLRDSDGQELCLQVNGGSFFNGQTVGVNYCLTDNVNYAPFQQWIYTQGSTKIRVAPNDRTDTEYCIDFGTNLGANGQSLKIWQCYDGLPQQQLYITDDNHIAVENGPGQCADVRAESGPEPIKPYGVQKQVQSWECSFGNTNQIFIFEDAPVPPEPEPTVPGEPITWINENGDQLCLQVNPEPLGLGNGRGVGVSGCVPEEFDYVRFQRWTYTRGSTTIRVATPDDQGIEYCLDFGTNLGVNGQGLKIWQCYDGLPQQQLYITDDNHIAVENGPGQCADVRAESVPRPVRPYGVIKDAQSWQCIGGNTNQIFGFA